MTALAIVLVLLGLMIALTRAPLIVAPEATRAFYLKWFETDGRMRALGGLVVAMGLLMIWAAYGETGTAASLVYGLGLFMAALAAFFAALPGPARNLATSIWSKFSTATLRTLGAVAVIFGLAIAAYGLNM